MYIFHTQTHIYNIYIAMLRKYLYIHVSIYNSIVELGQNVV